MRHNLTVGNYEHLKDQFQGERVFIVGSGISLIGFNYGQLAKEKVIVLNHAFKMFPFFKWHVFLDTRFLQESKLYDDNGFTFHAMPWQKITSSHSTIAPRENLAVIKPSNNFSYDPKAGFYSPKNSACFAISCAIYGGAKEIYLLGIDCRFADKEEAMYIASSNDNVQEYYRIQRSDRQIYGHATSGIFDHTLDEKKDESVFTSMASLFDVFDGKGKIFNCSMWSRIKTFPIVDLRDIL